MSWATTDDGRGPLGANVGAIQANDFHAMWTDADKRMAIMSASGPIRTTLNG